jgi:hypothetical protein
VYLNPENTVPNQGLTSLGAVPLGQVPNNQRMASKRFVAMPIAYFNWKKTTAK